VTLRLLLAILTLVGVVAACGTQEQSQNAQSDPLLVEKGADLYAANCAQCHGADLRGTDQGPSFLSEVYVPSHHGDAAFHAAVAGGVPPHHWSFGPMPPVEGLTPEDVEAIVAFVRDTQQTEGFES